MNEIIYVLTNDMMPGLVKIGRTAKTLNQRMRELSRATGVPIPFTCVFAGKVKDSKFVEDCLHRVFQDYRGNAKREFFTVSQERVIWALKLMQGELEDITPKKDIVFSEEDQIKLNKAREEIREKFNFGMVNIPIGAELYFSRDENIKATVVDNKHINFNNEITTLSNSAQKILRYDYGVQGTAYWKYGEETLDERRKRMRNEEE